MKKILVPCRNGNDQVELPPISEEERLKDEKERRETSLKLLISSIQATEKKHAKELSLLKDELSKTDFSSEAEYYLRETNYNFKEAYKMYYDELMLEIQLAKEAKFQKQLHNGKGPKKNTACTIF